MFFKLLSDIIKSFLLNTNITHLSISYPLSVEQSFFQLVLLRKHSFKSDPLTTFSNLQLSIFSKLFLSYFHKYHSRYLFYVFPYFFRYYLSDFLSKVTHLTIHSSKSVSHCCFPMFIVLVPVERPSVIYCRNQTLQDLEVLGEVNS
jgi:hypothetical protein